MFLFIRLFKEICELFFKGLFNNPFCLAVFLLFFKKKNVNYSDIDGKNILHNLSTKQLVFDNFHDNVEKQMSHF